ncbi:MAG: vWA domain-containing protein [Planctomycetota bacterium]
MILENPWGLLALASVAAIVAIHLFQRRFRRRQVAGLFLWLRGKKAAPPGKAIKPPPATLSLFLEIAACAILSLLLAGARLRSETRSKRFLFVLDGSASMGAKPPGGPSFAERAREKIRENLAPSPGARATIFSSGKTPRLIFGPEGDPRGVAASLEAWSPEEPGHEILESVGLARTTSGSEGPVIVVSDHLPGSLPEGVSWIAVGEPLPNAGFVAASRRRKDPRTDIVRLSLRSFGGPEELEVWVREGSREIFREKVSLKGETHLELAVPSDAGTLVAEIPEDPLSIDNRAFLAPPLVKVVRCRNLAAGPEKAAIDRALRSLEGVAIVEEPPWDLAVGPGTLALKEPPGSWIFAFAPLPEEHIAGEARAFLGPYTIDARHPLLESVSLRGVVWSVQGELRVPSMPLASCGETALVAEAPPPHRGFLLNLDLARTNLTRTEAWPVLFDNLVTLRRESLPGPDRTILRAGDLLRLRLSSLEGRPIVLEGEGWSRVSEAAEEIFVPLPTRPMPIAVKLEGKELYSLAVNWHDARESDLSKLASGAAGDPRRSEEEEARRPISGDPLYKTLLALLAASLFGNWWLVGRGGPR